MEYGSIQERRTFSGGERFPIDNDPKINFQACRLSRAFEHKLGSTLLSWQERLQKGASSGNFFENLPSSYLPLFCVSSEDSFDPGEHWRQAQQEYDGEHL